jgi:hypothetical protein
MVRCDLSYNWTPYTSVKILFLSLFSVSAFYGKGKVILSFYWAPCSEGSLGECGYSSTHSLTSALMEVSGQLHAQAALPPRKDPLAPIG